jgi:hypothetical protein
MPFRVVVVISPATKKCQFLSGYRVVLGLGMVVDVDGFPAVQSRES